MIWRVRSRRLQGVAGYARARAGAQGMCLPCSVAASSCPLWLYSDEELSRNAARELKAAGE